MIHNAFDERQERFLPVVRARLLITAGAVAFLFVLMAYHVVRLHVLPDPRLAAEERAHIGEVEIREPRGDIYDRNGILLAADKRVSSLGADPGRIPDAMAAAEALGKALDVDSDELLKRIKNAGHRKFVWIERYLSEGEVAAFQAMDSVLQEGFILIEERERAYPQGALAAHALGFVNREGVGSIGVEAEFDQYLRGGIGWKKTRVDGRRNLLASLTLEYVEPEGGDKVTLTIDAAVQFDLEVELERLLVECQAAGALGILVDPASGEVVAMAAAPSVDLNHWQNSVHELFKNPFATVRFEPGTLLRLLPVAAALQSGLVSESTAIDCRRDVPVVDGLPDRLSFGELFVQSPVGSGMAAARVVEQKALLEWSQVLGFQQAAFPEILAGEQATTDWRESTERMGVDAEGFGRKALVSAPQLLRAFSSIANGGTVPTFSIVRTITDRTDALVLKPEREGYRVLLPETARCMRGLYQRFLQERLASLGRSIAGDIGGDYAVIDVESGAQAVFVGFAPVEAPEYCAVLMVDAPDKARRDVGADLAEIFSKIVGRLMVSQGK